jgi:hypothetical protein
MIQLKVPTHSAMDNNIEAEWALSESYELITWTMYLESLPYVKSARFVFKTTLNGDSHTLITFESEEHKTWFILRWS